MKITKIRGLFVVTTTGGETPDRFTVYAWDGETYHEGEPVVYRYTMSSNPTSPRGVCTTEWVNERNGRFSFPDDFMVALSNCPESVQAVLEEDLGESVSELDFFDSRKQFEGMDQDLRGANVEFMGDDLGVLEDNLQERYEQGDIPTLDWMDDGWIIDDGTGVQFTDEAKEMLRNDERILRENIENWLEETFQSVHFDVPLELGPPGAQGVLVFDGNDPDPIQEMEATPFGSGFIRRYPQDFDPSEDHDSFFEGVSDLRAELAGFSLEFGGLDVIQRHQARSKLMDNLTEESFESDELNRTSWDNIPGKSQEALLEFYGYEPNEFPNQEEMNRLYEIWADHQTVEEPESESSLQR